jgi:hypothetical protein
MLRKPNSKRSGPERIAVVIGTLVTLCVASENVLAEPGDLLRERRGRAPHVSDPSRPAVSTGAPGEIVIPIDPPPSNPKRGRIPPRTAPAANSGRAVQGDGASWLGSAWIYLLSR